MLLYDETDAVVRVQLSRLINVKVIAWERTGFKGPAARKREHGPMRYGSGSGSG